MTDMHHGAPAMITARIERLPLSRWHARLFGAIGSAHLFDVFDGTALAFALPVLVGLWQISPAQAGVLLGSGFAGQLVGAVLVGIAAGKYGRIVTLRLCLVAMSVMSLLCALAPSYLILLILRVVQGVGLGGETPIAATYMNEVCGPRYRGRMIIAIQLMAAAGALAASIAGFLLIPLFGWRSLFFVGTVPVLLGLALRRLLPESPKWLASRGRFDEADAAMHRIEQGVFRDRPIPPVVPTHEIPQPAAAIAITTTHGAKIGELLSPTLRRRTLSAWIVAFCASTVGYGIIGWMPTIYRTVYHLSISTTLAFSMVSGVVSLIGTATGLILIDRIGRKPALVTGFALSSVAMATLVVLGSSIPPVAVMLLAATSLTVLGLPFAGIFVYAPELYDTRLRSLGTGVASAWLRLAAIVGAPIMGLLLTYGSVYVVYGFMSAVAAIGALGMAWLGIETVERPVAQ